MIYTDITPNTHDNLIRLDSAFKTAKYYGDHIAYLDGDIIVYKAAFANADNEDWEIVQNNVDAYLRNILNYIPVLGYKGFLSDSTSYRHELELPKPYKGNRTGDKPKWHKEINQYLRTSKGFGYVPNLEADDCISLLVSRCPDKCIVYTQDKDLFQLPCTLFNFVTKKLYEINEEQAYYNLWYQVMVGDVADNICGIPRVGDKKATNILSTLDQRKYRREVYMYYYHAYGRGLGYRYAYNTFKAIRLLRRSEMLDKVNQIPLVII